MGRGWGEEGEGRERGCVGCPEAASRPPAQLQQVPRAQPPARHPSYQPYAACPAATNNRWHQPTAQPTAATAASFPGLAHPPAYTLTSR